MPHRKHALVLPSLTSLLALLACGDSGELGEPPAPRLDPAGAGGSMGTGSESPTPDATGASGSSAGSAGAGAMPNDADAPKGGVWFSDDFESGNAERWVLTPGEGASFAVVTEPGTENQVLQYSAGSSTNNLIALLGDKAWAEAEQRAGTRPLADYYVEARIKPQTNSTTSNKHLYFVARYQDEANWYLGGLNVQNDPGNTRVELGHRKGGSVSRPEQTRRPILQGTPGENDGQWYSVRLELLGQTLTAYLDGDSVGSLEDADFASGKFGLYTSNKSFLIDDVVVGDPSTKPISLLLDPPSLAVSAEALAEPVEVTVTALLGDGVTPDTFDVATDNAAVVSVSVEGAVVRLTPLTEGQARVTFTSGSKPGLRKVLSFTVTPAYEDSPSVYPDLAKRTDPAVGQAGVLEDTPLALAFDAPPLLTGQGSVRIFRVRDGAQVDTVFSGGESDALGPDQGTNDGRVRHVATTPLSVSGNTLTVRLHTARLEPGEQYSVGVAAETVDGTLGGLPFAGLGAAAGWTFTTRSEVPTGASVTVDDDGPADFRTVQGALNHVMQNVTEKDPATVSIRNGTYRELLFLRGKDNLTIQGESREGVVVEYENFESFNSGTGGSTTTPGAVPGGGRSVLLVEGADLLTLDQLTIRNLHQRTGSGDQAETLYFNADSGRLVATNSNFLSEQDTVQLKGYSWFFNSLVAGNVDFIWGGNRVALFEESEIRSVGDSRNSTPSGGYVLQARTATAEDKGFVFLNSSLTQGAGPAGTEVAPGETFLARSGGSDSYFDNVTFINCRLDTHIAPLGWAEAGVNGQPAPNPPTASAVSGWKEFGSTALDGTPLDLSARSAAARLLSEEEVEAEFSSRAAVFSAFGAGAGWDPSP